jgi:hypothetical protein
MGGLWQEDLQRFGVTPESILERATNGGKPDQAYIALMKFEIARAREYYRYGMLYMYMYMYTYMYMYVYIYIYIYTYIHIRIRIHMLGPASTIGMAC